MEHKRIFGLDLIRAIAVLSVVFAHSACLLTPLFKLPYGLGWFLENCSALGLLGVELFFVLSGFLIGGILIREFMTTDVFNLQSIKGFWMKRWSRTLPNYYFILGLNILLFSRSSFDGRFLFFVQNLATPHPLFFPEAWSLSVEEWFYLTLPLALLLLTKILKNTPKKSILKTTFIVYLSIFTCIRIINAIHPYFEGLDQDASIRKITLFRLDAIVYGVIIAYFNHFHSSFLKKRRVKNTMLTIGISFTILLVVISFLSYHPNFNYYNESRTYRFLSDSFLYSLLPLSLSFVLPAALLMKTPSNVFKFKAVITHISLISYSMYLIHYSLVLTFFQIIHTNSSSVSIANYCGYWLITILIATIIYYFYEKPTISLLRGKLIKTLSISDVGFGISAVHRRNPKSHIRNGTD